MESLLGRLDRIAGGRHAGYTVPEEGRDHPRTRRAFVVIAWLLVAELVIGTTAVVIALVLTLGGTGATAPIVLSNVANGVNQYDAVNFGQLSELANKVEGVQDRVSILEQAPAGDSGGSAGAGGSIGWDLDAGGEKITNVGNATEKSDAVNLGQMNDAIQASVGLPAGTTAKDYTDQQIQGVRGQINDVSKNAYSGIAAATALTMIPGVDPGKTLSFGIGGATYKGYQAVALGGEARINQNLKVKGGVGLSSGGNTVGMGASYQW